MRVQCSPTSLEISRRDSPAFCARLKLSKRSACALSILRAKLACARRRSWRAFSCLASAMSSSLEVADSLVRLGACTHSQRFSYCLAGVLGCPPLKLGNRHQALAPPADQSKLRRDIGIEEVRADPD